MSLWCPLYINGEVVGSVGAQRTEGAGMGPDDVNVYAAVVQLGERHWGGSVSHRYGDGAWGLVRRVLEAAELEAKS